MKLTTEKKFREILKNSEELVELIESKTIQMSLMLYDRSPKGRFITNLDELDEKDGKICVQFESYSCQDTDYATFYLPLEFLFYESYPENYKLIWKEEKRKEKEERKRKDREKKDNEKKRCEIFERKEYEYLKLKYEKKE